MDIENGPHQVGLPVSAIPQVGHRPICVLFEEMVASQTRESGPFQDQCSGTRGASEAFAFTLRESQVDAIAKIHPRQGQTTARVERRQETKPEIMSEHEQFIPVPRQA